MAVDVTALADSAPAETTAPGGDTGAAVESAEVTHGETVEPGATPEPESSGEPTEELDDNAFEDQIKDLPEEEKKSQSQKRRERREQREAQRINEAVEARIAEREAAARVKAEADKAEAEARAAAEAWQQEFGSFVGTPEARTRLDQEIAALTTEVTGLKPYAEGVDLDVLEQKQTQLAAKVGERERLNQNAEQYRKVDEFQFRQTQHQFAGAASDLPPEFQSRYFAAKDVPTALAVLKEGLRAAAAAQTAAEVAKVRAELTGELEKERAAHAATRTGAPGAGAAPNGTNGGGTAGGEIYTRDRLRQMMQTPDGIAEYRRNRSEIERQERAGLIR